MSKRNINIEQAVDDILAEVDSFIEGKKLKSLPSPVARAMVDVQLANSANSVRLASLFLVFYSISEPSWNCDSIPQGIRGKYGDKRLANELNLRHITLHNSITAFGENLGWKGNVKAARLRGDNRFDAFSLTLGQLSPDDRSRAASYMASRFAESRVLVSALPPVGDEVLTFARARQLFYNLIGIRSEGNIQQFLVAALLEVHRLRFGLEIRTHHVHASDKSDGTAGDIEELQGNDLLRAYEVTVRPDWKNRITDFRAKMDQFGLKKYTIIASNVSSDDQLAEPANLVRFLHPYGRDIAVVDLNDFIDVFTMELSADELRRAVNQAHDYLVAPTLCGRLDIIESYSKCVSSWLDEN